MSRGKPPVMRHQRERPKKRIDKYRMPNGSLPKRAFWAYIAEDAGVTVEQAQAVLRAATDLGALEMANGYSITWPGVGSFMPTTRTYQNRKTGELSFRVHFAFKAAPPFREAYRMWQNRDIEFGDLDNWIERPGIAPDRVGKGITKAAEALLERRMGRRIEL